MHYIKYIVITFLLVSLFSCSADDQYVKLDISPSTDKALFELQELAHEFTSQLPLNGTKNAADEVSTLAEQYSDHFYDLITHLKESGADDESISTYFSKGVRNAASESVVIRFKGTPCWDTYQNHQTTAAVGAAGCMLVAGATTGPVGVGACLIAFSSAMTAAKVNYDRCIERTYP